MSGSRRAIVTGALIALGACATACHETSSKGTDGGSSASGDLSVDDAPDASVVPGSDGGSDTDGSTDAGNADASSACGILTVTCPTGCCSVPSVDIAPLGSYPSVATDTQGYVYVSYTEVRSTVWGTGFAIFDPTTSTWSTSDLMGGSERSVVRVDASGRVHHLYGISTGGVSSGSGFITYRFSDDHGATWTTRPLGAPLATGGTLDLAIGASSAPHVVFQRDRTSGSFSELVYATWTGSAWSFQVLDGATTADEHPMVALGFSDRPHVVADAFEPGGVSGTRSMRHVFYDGAAWHSEDIDSGQQYSTNCPAGPSVAAADYYLASQVEVLPDDSVHATYARCAASTTSLVLATRTPGSSGAWSTGVLSGVASGFADAWYVRDVGGAPGIVASGLTSYSQAIPGTFTSTSTGLPGSGPGVAVVGNSLYVAYTSTASGTSGHLLFSLVKL